LPTDVPLDIFEDTEEDDQKTEGEIPLSFEPFTVILDNTTTNVVRVLNVDHDPDFLSRFALLF